MKENINQRVRSLTFQRKSFSALRHSLLDKDGTEEGQRLNCDSELTYLIRESHSIKLDRIFTSLPDPESVQV